MTAFWQKKRKRRHLRRGVCSDGSETEDAIEELENEKSVSAKLLQVYKRESTLVRGKRNFDEEIGRELAEDQVLNEVRSQGS